MAALDVRASVQPAHLLDDRDLTELIWPGRAERSFAFRWMLDDGVELALGSDAPVSPLDPWLAIAAAVHRSADDREPWHGEQALTPAEALAASVDGQPTVGVGSPGDLVLLDADPLALGADSAATGHGAATHVGRADRGRRSRRALDALLGPRAELGTIRSATACCSAANGWKAIARVRSVLTPLTQASGPAQMSWPLLACHQVDEGGVALRGRRAQRVVELHRRATRT